jgi:peptidoglycan/xylan/chitin deacetylase (PgdA/CDA1 family)
VTDHPLELLLRPQWPAPVADGTAAAGIQARVVCRQGGDPAGWLRAGDWRVFAAPADVATLGGAVLERFHRNGGGHVDAVQEDRGDVIVPFSLRAAYDAYVSEAWRGASSNFRLSERSLRAFYGLKPLIPRPLQLAARRRLVRSQGVPDFPAWPLDLSVSRLLRFYAACTLRAAGLTRGDFLWFWPDGHTAAVILTHDVETDDGVRLALELADLEQEHGFRSSFNFGAWYERLDAGVLRELVDRGFEVGMHGLTHDRQLFASRAAFEERLAPLADLADRLGAVGFRSPATHRVFEWIAELPVEYDCTMPNSDPYEPIPGGCCSIWPFFIGEVVELPYTLPQDHTLLTLLDHRSPALWLEQAAAIQRAHGLIQCVSHPDPGYLGDARKRAVYAEFLRGLADASGLWRALPRDVAAWWRRRGDADAADEPRLRRGTARLDDGGASVAFEPPLP